MWFPTKAAMDRAALLRILERHETQAKGSGHSQDAANSNPGEGPTDLSMVYSMQIDCHRQLVNISRGLWFVAAIGLFLIFRLLR